MSEDSPTSTTIPPSVLSRLVPDYRAFVEAQPPSRRIALHTIEWDPEFRQLQLAVPPPDQGEAGPVPVGSTRTVQVGKFSVLVLTPDGERPTKGWPVFLNIHGGGWVFGTKESRISLCSRACVSQLHLVPIYLFVLSHSVL